MAVRLKKADYTTSELIEITNQLISSETENYELNNAFWSRSEKDASLIRNKYHRQLLTTLISREREEKNQATLFG